MNMIPRCDEVDKALLKASLTTHRLAGGDLVGKDLDREFMIN